MSLLLVLALSLATSMSATTLYLRAYHMRVVEPLLRLLKLTNKNMSDLVEESVSLAKASNNRDERIYKLCSFNSVLFMNLIGMSIQEFEEKRAEHDEAYDDAVKSYRSNLQ